MAEETTAPATPATETEATPDPAQATPAGAKNTETHAEPMIPKSRFDEVNNRLKAIESERAKAEKAAKEAETARLAEEGKFKELFERQQAELAKERQERETASRKLMQRDAAEQAKLPAVLAERLRGDTLEEMLADAKTLLAALPKPTAPNINAQPGAGGAPSAGALDDDAKQRLADRYGINPKYL